MTPSTGSNSPNLGEEFLDKILIIPSQKDLTNWLALVPATLLKMCSFFFFLYKEGPGWNTQGSLSPETPPDY